jgi:hypothetical protein
MSAELLYLDTSIWNALCDQQVDARTLLSNLADRNARLVLGPNVVYELAKTFGANTPGMSERGRTLFSYLQRFVRANISVFNEPAVLLRQEAARAAGEIDRVEVFWNQANYSSLLSAVDNLSQGEFDENAKLFIKNRKSAARQTRFDMSGHLASRPALAQALERVNEDSLRPWIDREAKGPGGRRVLQSQLAIVFERRPDRKLTLLAKKLLANRRYRISHALVRSAVYLNWRSAHRGSIRSDVPDDAYHGVNACYCDVFVTTEPDQAFHADLVNSNVRAISYDASVPLAVWLPQNA